jgi:hypothetical protein
LSNLSATEGFAINGHYSGDTLGYSVSSAGDVNGDGLADLIVGAAGADPNGNNASGTSYVVFGKTDGAAIELSAFAATDGFVIDGANTGDRSGYSVSDAGDVNGDGLDDLIVGAPFNDTAGTETGTSYVVFGKTDGSAIQLSNLSGTDGFHIFGAANGDESGVSVSAAGDVNGDGLADLIVGARYAAPGGNTDAGASYVVFGKTDGASVQLSNFAATDGFVINGASASDETGVSVSAAGDVNGDGLDDLIVGANEAAPNGTASGVSYVVYGKTDGAAVEASDVAVGVGGFVINGVAAGDEAGVSVSSAGDVNGDGFGDLIVGASEDDPNGNSEAGAGFIVFGGDFNGVTTQIGTAGIDALIGSAAADRIVAGASSDIIDGGGGADVIRGGAGNDGIAVSDVNFADIDGGTGSDTLNLNAMGLHLDLTALDNTSLSGIERILLFGRGNTLTLDAIELQRLSDTSNTLRVFGDARDTVNIVGDGMFRIGQVTDSEGTFDVFTLGEARLEVSQGVAVTGVRVAGVELSELVSDTDTRGFLLEGPGGGDQAGFSVSGAGDVDGFDDVIVGALNEDPTGAGNRGNAGISFVIYGKTDGVAIDLADVKDPALTPLLTEGFAINGEVRNDRSGASVSGAGDVNGDGLADVIVGARDADPNGAQSGESYVVFGRPGDSIVELFDVADPGDNSGFTINGIAARDRSGFSVSGAGDVNGDGLDDVIVGAPRNPNSSANQNDGLSFVVFGKADGGVIELSNVENPANTPGIREGFVINDATGADRSGFSVSGAGDVNGDGMADLIVGAYLSDPGGVRNKGSSYIVFGKTSDTPIELSVVEDTLLTPGIIEGFVVRGTGRDDQSGRFVSAAGDVNGDGLDDLIIGARLDDPNGRGNSGASFVVFGKTGDAPIELSDLEDPARTPTITEGFVINGVTNNDRSGFSVSAAGDVNGDGLDDLIIGAYRADPNGNGDAGESYVVFGKTDGSVVNLSDVEEGFGGFVINGITNGDRAGVSVSGAGDVNGDGFDDLVVGANLSDGGGNSSGSAYIIYGGDFTASATDLGTDGADAITGTAQNDNIFTGAGDDTITTSAGQDRLSGGQGADTFELLDVTGNSELIDFRQIEGDQLDVRAFSTSFGALSISAAGAGGLDTRIDLDGDTSVTLIGILSTDLVAGDFIF